MKILREFYSFNWNQNEPKLILVPDRETFDKLVGEKTKGWNIASSDFAENIYLLSKENFERDSTHKYSKEEYTKTITHELSHKFFQTITDSHYPVWLDEGIAQYTAGQYKDYHVETFSKFLNLFDKMSSDSYTECAFAVKCLLDNFKKENLIKLLDSISKEEKTEKTFKKNFEAIYKIELSSESFNSLLKRGNK